MKTFRMIIKQVITAEDEANLPTKKTLLKDCDNPTVLKILDQLRAHVNFTIKEKSYCKLETLNRGHKWHTDTGNKNHMRWCTIGGTMILSGQHTGGHLVYSTKRGNKRITNRQLYDLYVHSSDVLHMVTPSKGTRRVFLLFI